MAKRIARVELRAEEGRRIGTYNGTAFFAALDAQRVAKGLNWKQVAEAAGVSASTLTRMAQGKRPDVDSLAALSRWSGLSVDDFLSPPRRAARNPSALAAISAHLRSDPQLSPESAAAIEDIVKAAYERLKHK